MEETEVSSSQSTMQEGGYDYEVVDTGLFDEFYCSVCHKLKRNAVELKCHHSLCSSCLDKWQIQADEMKIDFNCPQCHRSIDIGMIQYSGTMNRMIQTSIRVKCSNLSLGCDWIGVIADIQEHIDRTCKYTVIKCTFTGCGVYVQRKELDKHLRTCPYRSTLCKHCGGEIVGINLNKHHWSECRLFPVACSNEGCQEIIARESVHLHETNECSFIKIACQYASVGCSVKFPRVKQEDHEKQSMASHMSLLQKRNLSLQKVLQTTETELTSSKAELKSTKADLKSSKADLMSTKVDLKTTQAALKSTKVKLKTTEANLTSTKADLKSTKADLKSIRADLKTAKAGLKATKADLKSTKADVKTLFKF